MQLVLQTVAQAPPQFGSDCGGRGQVLWPTTRSVLDIDVLRASLKNPEIALQLILVLIERARGATESVMNLALADGYTRVRGLLLSLSQDNGDGTKTIPDRMTQKWCADRVGARRDIVSKICIQLVKEDYLRSRARSIRFCGGYRSGFECLVEPDQDSAASLGLRTTLLFGSQLIEPPLKFCQGSLVEGTHRRLRGECFPSGRLHSAREGGLPGLERTQACL